MMTQTVTIQATGVNKSIYLSADTLRKISELPDGNNLSALVRRLIDSHYAAQKTTAKGKSAAATKVAAVR